MDEIKPTVKKPSKTFILVQWGIVLSLLGYSGYHLLSTLRNLYAHNTLEQTRDVSTPAVHQPMYTKIRHEGDKQYLWAKGSKDPDHETSQWFDLTESPLPLENFQYGIGRDTIPSIDHPVFVNPDDPRLLQRWKRFVDGRIERLKIIGYESNGIARAYPISLLSRHELVNDDFAGNPVTVGW